MDITYIKDAKSRAAWKNYLKLILLEKQLQAVNLLLDEANIPEFVTLEEDDITAANAAHCRLKYYLLRRKSLKDYELNEEDVKFSKEMKELRQ